MPNLKGVDPDDAFSSVPYEKGFALLYYLECLVGGPGTVLRHRHIIIVVLQRCSTSIFVHMLSTLSTKLSQLMIGRAFSSHIFINKFVCVCVFVCINPYACAYVYYFIMQAEEGVLDGVEWYKWLYAPGMPPYNPR